MGHHFLHAFLWTVAVLIPFTGLLHLFPRLGAPGRAIAAWCCRAPGLDVVVTVLTALPWIIGPIIWGWGGLFGGVLGQLVVLIGWTIAHELWHYDQRHRPKLYRVHNRLIGMPRNLSSVYMTAFAIPVFTLTRAAEYLVYPYLVYVTNFPGYNHREWVAVSRQKYGGLIGHDRIWCLYCDWMTGVWSLGTEMLRNVESFWCPIKFASGAKCDNCKLDFPDVVHGWAPADGSVEDAAAVLERQYLNEPRPPKNAWFGHPVRLTVKGQQPPQP